ncbi:proton-coupled zinc antiporter SLC30A1-like isoform X1 [Hyla sarda]|uniref:proton-coupled zinc antiporter SLC30A1-like isoform X1 n=2 Tax=Hyla sarda TaxID=327740 RepID=UPI0024C35868|nr:proton-coupled zinc antiporter SLC30A1-like isoform X1 [Hyla sarda]
MEGGTADTTEEQRVGQVGKVSTMVSHAVLLAVSFAVFLTQIVLSRLSDSLLTLADSAHTISIVIALCPSLIVTYLPSIPPQAKARLPTLFSLLSPLFLSSLCLSLTLGSLGHLVHPHHSHRPALIFVAGVLGLLFNVTYMAVTGAFQGLCLSELQQYQPRWYLVLRMLCSLAPSSLLLASSLLLHLFSHPAVHYLDPALSLVSIAIMVASVYSDIVQNGSILLQAVPPSTKLQSLKLDLDLLCGPNGHHELHIWALAPDHGVASLHVHCSGMEEYKTILSQAKVLFKRHGIRELTIQPEFGSPGACALACGPACAHHSCCRAPHSLSNDLVLANVCT